MSWDVSWGCVVANVLTGVVSVCLDGCLDRWDICLGICLDVCRGECPGGCLDGYGGWMSWSMRMLWSMRMSWSTDRSEQSFLDTILCQRDHYGVRSPGTRRHSRCKVHAIPGMDHYYENTKHVVLGVSRTRGHQNAKIRRVTGTTSCCWFFLGPFFLAGAHSGDDWGDADFFGVESYCLLYDGAANGDFSPGIFYWFFLVVPWAPGLKSTFILQANPGRQLVVPPLGWSRQAFEPLENVVGSRLECLQIEVFSEA